ncbi:MAG: peptidyl-prolyl cis-trans isomerase [Lysinibacillus sp.]
MKFNRSNNEQKQQIQAASVPLSQRRLKTKPALTLIAVLFLGNIFWFLLWLLPFGDGKKGDEEIVASVGKTDITKQQWMSQMEELYGRETLQTIINAEVMEQAAKKNKIQVSDEEVELELKLIRSVQGANDTTLANLSDAQLREKIRAQLILEKVIAQDIVIEEGDAVTYYEENKALYNIETSFKTSVLVVASEKEAKKAREEIEKGSDFAVLARERSLHKTSASLGGEIGYITTSQEGVDAAITSAVEKLAIGEISKPIQLEDGNMALVLVTDVIEGQSFTFDEVKTQIERELAIEQLSGSVTPEMFWSEFDATWFYGDGK